jgi:hypothetical protein
LCRASWARCSPSSSAADTERRRRAASMARTVANTSIPGIPTTGHTPRPTRRSSANRPARRNRRPVVAVDTDPTGR